MAPDAQRMRITVEVDIASEPIRGSLEDATGSIIEFAGWLELMSAFEIASGTATADIDAERRQGE